MGRQQITLTKPVLLKALVAFKQGYSCAHICSLTGVSQGVWQRELHSHMGEEAFEAQLQKNRATPRRKRRAKPLGRPPAHPSTRPVDTFEEAAAALRERRTRQALIRQGGKATPVVCTTTGEAFPSIYATGKATGVPVHRIRRALDCEGEVPGPGGQQLIFRRWRRGDPKVSSRPRQESIPLRFEDGSSWPSAGALARELGASARELGRLRRHLRQIGYGPTAPALSLETMLMVAGQMPFLERERLERRIASWGCAPAS